MGGRATNQPARVLAALAVGWVIALAGCGGGGDSGGTAPPVTPPADTTPPAISEATVAPTTLSFTGGRVTVTAQVTDASGVARVWMVLTRPDGSTQTVDMARSSETAYGASCDAAANTVPGDPDDVYTVRIHARDARGNVAASAPLTFTVKAVEAPPPIPL